MAPLRRALKVIVIYYPHEPSAGSLRVLTLEVTCSNGSSNRLMPQARGIFRPGQVLGSSQLRKGDALGEYALGLREGYDGVMRGL